MVWRMTDEQTIHRLDHVERRQDEAQKDLMKLSERVRAIEVKVALAAAIGSLVGAGLAAAFIELAVRLA